jgi:hypothetical protein
MDNVQTVNNCTFFSAHTNVFGAEGMKINFFLKRFDIRIFKISYIIQLMKDKIFNK